MSIAIRLAVLLAVAGSALSAAEPKPAPIRIGMLSTMFRNHKPELFQAFKKPFIALVEMQTGVSGSLDLARDPEHLREELAAGKLQFALCHGFEFAWMREKDPTLKPLMIAAASHRPLKGLIVVAESSPARTICDLRNTKFAQPDGLHETARIFASRKCTCEGKTLAEFVREITRPANSETALHDVFDGKVQAALVDGLGLQCYRDRYPGRSRKLRVLAESHEFPLSVVAFRDRSVAANVVRQFEDGMRKAHTTPLGRQLLGLMQSAGFEAVPADYERMLAETLKLYPAGK